MDPLVLILVVVIAVLAIAFAIHHSHLTLSAGVGRLEQLLHLTHTAATAPTPAPVVVLSSPPASPAQPAAAPPATAPASVLTPITAQDAYKRYADAGGMAAAVTNKYFAGGLNLYELNWIRSLAAAARHQWAADFAASEKIDDASYNTVGGVPCTQNVASYLLTISDGYHISWDA